MPPSSDARSTRERILALLRSDSRTAAELAETIDISPQAVRDQLRPLEERGWVAVGGFRRDTGGKPAREYTLTAAGEESFAKPYAEVLRHVLRELDGRLGVRGKCAVFEAVGRRIGADAADPAPAAGERGRPRERLERAADVLNALGGAAVVEETDDGLRIRSDGCPLSRLVRDDPDVCRLAEALVERVSGIEVKETCDRSSRPRCRFEVASP